MTDAAAYLARRESPIVLTRTGQFLHAGEPIEHPGIVAAFRRWLARGEGGRFVLRASEREWCFLAVEDAALWVDAVRFEPDRMVLSLWDGTTETLAPETLAIDAEGVLRCTVRGLPARFGRHAQLILGDRLEATADGGWELPFGGRRVRLRAALA